MDINPSLEKNPIRLRPHPTARDQAVAIININPGTVIFSEPVLVSALLPQAKTYRCDYCHRVAAPGQALKRCTGCLAYWYCNASCQEAQWKAHHKRICQHFRDFASSPSYQILPLHLAMDSLLMSHLTAYLTVKHSPEDQSVIGLDIFKTLLPGPASNPEVPPICGRGSTSNKEMLLQLYSRFGNNNFSMHSHLSTYGYGIFPLTSRVFNHSCLPNAVARYSISSGAPVRMEIVSLRDITAGEQITLPYLDPALTQTRQQLLQYTYGFTCGCESCRFLRNIKLTANHYGEEELRTLSRSLRDLTGITSSQYMPVYDQSYKILPTELWPTLSENFLSQMTERFANSSHGGRYDEAFETGLTILAVYSIIYPHNYPQIGMHLLELAKSAWNAVVLQNSAAPSSAKEDARNFLVLSQKVLSIYGLEGDEGGPLDEIRTLESLLE